MQCIQILTKTKTGTVGGLHSGPDTGTTHASMISALLMMMKLMWLLDNNFSHRSKKNTLVVSLSLYILAFRDDADKYIHK